MTTGLPLTINSAVEIVLTFLRRYVDAQPVGAVVEWDPNELDLKKIAKGTRVVQSYASVYLRRGERKEIVLLSPDASIEWRVKIDVVGPIDGNIGGKRKFFCISKKDVRLSIGRSEYGFEK